MLERVIANLVGNAVHPQSPAERKVLLTASAHDGPRGTAAFVDRGPGLPPGSRERLFEAVPRNWETRDNTTGLGLGLALSKGLTEAMDGTLTPRRSPAVA